MTEVGREYHWSGRSGVERESVGFVRGSVNFVAGEFAYVCRDGGVLTIGGMVLL